MVRVKNKKITAVLKDFPVFSSVCRVGPCHARWKLGISLRSIRACHGGNITIEDGEVVLMHEVVLMRTKVFQEVQTQADRINEVGVMPV
jgi:hypothetical protein